MVSRLTEINRSSVVLVLFWANWMASMATF